MPQLTLGVISQTRKENERRLPIHPQHLERIDPDIRDHLYFEHGYAERFGVSDEQLLPWVAGLRTREQLIAECDVILLAKPEAADLAELRTGQVLWGWPHCVQSAKLTQQAIDRRLTIIAFEAMNHWSARGSFKLHVFHKNNEMAGYCSVLHAMELIGTTGTYGRRLRAAVIGFGATARGAVTALNAHGVHDIDILTNRGVSAVASPIHSAQIVQFEHDPESPDRSHALVDEGRVPLAGYLAEHDIVVNCVLQDPSSGLEARVGGRDRVPQRGRARLVPSGQPAHRRILRRGNGFQLGGAHHVRAADVHRRRQHHLLRGRPQPLLPVELRHLGDQRSPVALSAVGARRTPGVAGRSDDPARHRTPRRRGPEPGHPVVSEPGTGLPASLPNDAVDVAPAAGPALESTALVHLVGAPGRYEVRRELHLSVGVRDVAGHGVGDL